MAQFPLSVNFANELHHFKAQTESKHCISEHESQFFISDKQEPKQNKLDTAIKA